MNALRQLEWALQELQQNTPLASVSGAISEIAPTHGAVQRSMSAISMTRQIPYRVEPLISAAVA